MGRIDRQSVLLCRGSSDDLSFFGLGRLTHSPALGGGRFRLRGPGRLEGDRANVRGQDVTELIEVVCPADIFSDTHAVQGGRLFRKVSLSDDDDRRLPREDGGCPEETVELIVVAAVTGEMNDNEPGARRFQERGRLVERGRHHEPALLAELVSELSSKHLEKCRVGRYGQNWSG
jgi:hypothetical protein